MKRSYRSKLRSEVNYIYAWIDIQCNVLFFKNSTLCCNATFHTTLRPAFSHAITFSQSSSITFSVFVRVVNDQCQTAGDIVLFNCYFRGKFKFLAGSVQKCGESVSMMLCDTWYRVGEAEKISGVNFIIRWLHSVRNVWGHEVWSQQSCWFKGEIKVIPAYFIFCAEMDSFGSRNATKPNLSNKKSLENLLVPLQRDQDGQSIQSIQPWSWHGIHFPLYLTDFIQIHPTTFLCYHQPNWSMFLKWLIYFGTIEMGSWLTYFGGGITEVLSLIQFLAKKKKS